MKNSYGQKHLAPFTFRAGTEGDFLRCAEIWMRAVSVRDGTRTDPQMKHRALAKLTIPGSVVSVAEAGTNIYGFALALEKDPNHKAGRAHLSLLAVDPTYQSHGLGRALLTGITERLVSEGFTEVTLGVLEENLAARKIYEDAGWEVTGYGTFKDSGRPSVHYLLKAATA